MTDTTPNDQIPTNDPQTDHTPADDQTVPETEEGTGREAAKYRRRLRETETERDALTARVETMQRAEVERLAEASKLKGTAFWAAGTELADVLDDAGDVDAQKVAEAILMARETLGIPASWGNRAPREGYSTPMTYPSEFDRMADIVSGG